MLKKIDKSFESRTNAPYCFENKKGDQIDIINPHHKRIRFSDSRSEKFFEDVIKLEMNGSDWIKNSRLFSSYIIGISGKIAKMTTIHPLEFLLYKNWLSFQPDRYDVKKLRDGSQAEVVYQLITEKMPFFDLDEELKRLIHIKKEVIDLFRFNFLECKKSADINQADRFKPISPNIDNS